MEKIIRLSPYGALCLMAYAIGTQGINIIFSLGKLIMAQIPAMLLHYLVFGGSIIFFLQKIPIPFYKKVYYIKY
jgi:L-cystine uptake protein TcyP (sodium:dicarboxylate symporter family)